MSSFHQGLSAEFLVCADLNRQGFTAFLSAAGLRYDLVVDIDGRLLRVQVKSAAKPMCESNSTTPAYKFQFTPRPRSKPISPEQVDIVALVAFDVGVIGYLSAARCTGSALRIRPVGAATNNWTYKSNQIDQLPFSKVLEELFKDEDSKQNSHQR